MVADEFSEDVERCRIDDHVERSGRPFLSYARVVAVADSLLAEIITSFAGEAWCGQFIVTRKGYGPTAAIQVDRFQSRLTG